MVRVSSDAREPYENLQHEFVLAAEYWDDNDELIEDIAKLGYLKGRVLDPTYGYGVFWKRFRPDELVASDIDPTKSPIGYAVDIIDPTCDWWEPESFDSVVLDMPYKLNGNPAEWEEFTAERYGAHERLNYMVRIDRIYQAMDRCVFYLKPGGFLLVKCMDQVCSGHVRWQTDMFTRYAEDELMMRKVDRFDLLTNPREQPEGRGQVHARRNYSTMLVFQKSKGRA